MTTTQAKMKATRSAASGSVADLATVAQAPDVGTPRAKKVVSQPTASQLRKAADRARKAGVEPLAKKYDKVAGEAARREQGSD